MKNKIKIISIMMALMIGLTCGLPMGGAVYASGKYPPAVLIAQTKNVTERLRKGDTFSVSLVFSADDKQQFANKVSVSVSGSGQGGRSHINTYESGENVVGNARIDMSDIVYTGEGKEATVWIQYAGYSEPIKAVVYLDNAEPTQEAATGLKLSNNVVNVVTGARQQVAIQLINTGESITEPGKMTFKLEDTKVSKGIDILTKEVKIPEMRKGERKDFYINVNIDETVTRGIHKIAVMIDDVPHTLQLKVDSNFMPPALEVALQQGEQFTPGVAKEAVFAIKNVGHVDAKNVKIEFVPNDKVIVTNGSNVRYVQTVASGKTNQVKVGLQVLDSSGVVVPLQMRLSYIDDLGQSKEDTQTVYLNTQKIAFAKELTIQGIKEPTGKQQVGDTFKIGFDLFAEDGANNVTVSVKGPEGIVPASKNMFVVRSLAKNQKQHFEASFIADESVATGTYLMEIEAKYRLNNEEVSLKQYTTVSIENKKSTENDNQSGTGKPKVIIGMYEANPVVVKAGENFQLTLGFLNTHSDKPIYNLKANISVREQGENNTGSVFTPVGASNTFFIQQMAPGQLVQKDITLYTLPSAKPKTYEITIDMEYEDGEGVELKAIENIGIPVEQITKLEVADIQVDRAELHMEAYMTARIYNTGRTTISNVKIQTIGEGFEVRDNTLFIGRLEMGGTEVYEPTIIPQQDGMLQGKVIIEYEDVAGEVHTMEHDFEFEVMGAPVFPGEEMWPEENFPPMEEEQQKSKLPLIIGIIVGIMVAAATTFIVLKKRRQKRDEFELDETN